MLQVNTQVHSVATLSHRSKRNSQHHLTLYKILSCTWVLSWVVGMTITYTPNYNLHAIFHLRQYQKRHITVVLVKVITGN